MRLSYLCNVILLASWLLSPAVAADSAPPSEPLRIGVTPVFLNYQTSFLQDWGDYLEQRIHRPIRFVQRTTYREITDLLIDRQLDFAWICGFPFVALQSQLRLTAVPVYKGEPLYQSYLIVPTLDQETQSLMDLKGRIFAYSDPDSNSGYLVPQFLLHQLGKDDQTFFRKTFFTWAHEKVVEAVAFGVANGGAVDGYVWETLRALNPEITDRTRVIYKSDRFGFPPLVTHLGTSARTFDRFQSALMGMRDNDQGRALLKRLNLDAFVIGSDDLYSGIEKMMATLGKR